LSGVCIVEIRYDTEYNQVYICFQPEKTSIGCVVKSVEVVTDELVLDYMSDGSLYGIDILPTSQKITFVDLTT